MDTLDFYLNKLDDFDNLTQLHVLFEEIKIIYANNIKPNNDWYENRIVKIYKYSELDWLNISKQFKKNSYMFHTSKKIHYLIQYILNEWSSNPYFNLFQYGILLENISSLWDYYSKNYIGQEKDDDIVDLTIELANI